MIFVDELVHLYELSVSFCFCVAPLGADGARARVTGEAALRGSEEREPASAEGHTGESRVRDSYRLDQR